jgi:hypothetical protein
MLYKFADEGIVTSRKRTFDLTPILVTNILLSVKTLHGLIQKDIILYSPLHVLFR